jgi:predicted RNA methylase
MVWYAFFLTIMGVLIVGIGGVTTFKGLFIKLLIIIGCINTMTNPPHILRKYTDSGKDVSDMLKQFKDGMTFQNVRKSNSYKYVKQHVTKEGREQLHKEKEKRQVNMSNWRKKALVKRSLIWELIKFRFKK